MTTSFLFCALCVGLVPSGLSASMVRLDTPHARSPDKSARRAMVIGEDASVMEYSSNVRGVDSQMKPLLAGRGAKEGARDVVICRGIGDMSMAQFKELSDIWNRYATEKVITATSSLLYKISDDGKFKPFVDPPKQGEAGIDYEQVTKDYLSPKGLKALPHVWCDASCCKNCKLPTALVAAMQRPAAFFEESVAAAKKFGWHGYALDFEGNTGDVQKLTIFFRNWAKELAKHQGPSGHPLELHLWTGSRADEHALKNVMSSVVDMGNYFNRHFYDDKENEQKKEELEAANWRKMRARSLLQTNGKSSICPASDAKLAAYDNLLEEITAKHKLMDAKARLAGINSNMDACSHGYKEKCALGLITYDLPNEDLSCDDMLRVGHKATRNNVQSMWIWSGGLMSTQWKVGLRHFIEGESDYVLDEESSSLCTPDVMLRQDDQSNTTACSKCKFDGQFCCDGSFRQGKHR